MPRPTKPTPAPKALAKVAPKPLVAPIQPPPIDPETLEKALIGGDIGALNPAQRMQYYSAVCQSLSLNPLTRPLEFTSIDGKTVLYARKDCTEQLRRRDGIKIVIKERKTEDGIHSVTALASLPTGREDEAIGAVPMVEPSFVVDWHPTERGKKVRVDNPHKGKPLSAEVRAKNMMLAETKAKRRVTLSIAGLGIPDESELEQSFEAAPVPEVVAAAEEKKGDAEVIAKGGTVVKIEPAKEEATKEDPKPTATETDKLLDVECHVGSANGPWLGKKVRDIAPKALLVLHNDWLTKLPAKPLNKDARLRDAVLARKALMEGDGTWPKEAPGTPAEAPKGETTALEAQKAGKQAKNERATPSGDGWKAVKIPIGKTAGKPLGDLTPDQVTAFFLQSARLPDEHAPFKNACREGAVAFGKHTQELERKYELIEKCAAEISRDWKEMNERMVAAGMIGGSKTEVIQLEDAEVCNLLNNWEAAMEEMRKL